MIPIVLKHSFEEEDRGEGDRGEGDRGEGDRGEGDRGEGDRGEEEEEDLLHIKKEEFNKVFLYLSQKRLEITEEEKSKLIVHHAIENLNFNEKIKMMKKSKLKEGGEDLVSRYFRERQVSNHYMLNDVFVCKFLDTNLDVMVAEPERFIEELKKKYNVSTFPFKLEKKDKKKDEEMKVIRDDAAKEFSQKFGAYVGFMGYKKITKGGDSEIVFKFKEHSEIFTINVLGKTCTEGSSNSERIEILNKVLRKLDERAILFSIEDITLTEKNRKEGKTKKDMLSKEDLCLALELLLRLCEIRKTEQKLWFLTPELALYFDLYRG
jgi:hypothetical protein